MRPAERGFLLLSSHLGDPDRKPLTTAQLRTLADRSWNLDTRDLQRQLELSDLVALGYGTQMSARILSLLAQEELLDCYLQEARRWGCVPITRASEEYPLAVRKRLGLDSPGVLWAKGDVAILNTPKVALVGSREIAPANRRFAQEVGRQAAIQGYTLVSGNARGADRIAQEACLAEGGQVIVVVADALKEHENKEHVLYLSEESFDQGFSSMRALSRNRIIHALGSMVLVAQCSQGMGGTWDGTVKNLRFGWSSVFCFRDGSSAMEQLAQLGAQLVDIHQLSTFAEIDKNIPSFFDW